MRLVIFISLIYITMSLVVEDGEECGPFCGIDNPSCNPTTSVCTVMENNYYNCYGGYTSPLRICTPLDIDDWYTIQTGKWCGVKHSLAVNRGTDTFSYDNLVQCKAWCKFYPGCAGLYYEASTKRCYYLDDTTDIGDSGDPNDKCMILINEVTLPPTPMPTPAPTQRVYSNAGSAYIFKRDSGGSWVQLALIEPSDLMDDQNFGQELSIGDENTVTIGNRVFEVQSTGEVNPLFSIQSNGTLVAQHGNRSVYLDNLNVEIFEGTTLIKTLSLPTRFTQTIAFSGRHLWVVIVGVLYHGDIESSSPEVVQTALTGILSGVMISDDTHLVISQDNQIKVHSIGNNLAVVKTISDTNDVVTMAIDENLLTVYNSQGQPTVYDIGTTPTTPPTTGSPTTGSPTTAPPTTGSPTTASPTTGSPTTAPPTTGSPTTAPPTTGSPTTGSPTTASPTTTIESYTTIVYHKVASNKVLVIVIVFEIIYTLLLTGVFCGSCSSSSDKYVIVN
jgi:hypothetical protein